VSTTLPPPPQPPAVKIVTSIFGGCSQSRSDAAQQLTDLHRASCDTACKEAWLLEFGQRCTDQCGTLAVSPQIANASPPMTPPDQSEDDSRAAGLGRDNALTAQSLQVALLDAERD